MVNSPPPPLLSAAEFAIGTGGKISASDPRVQPLIDGATAGIRRYCGWHVAGPWTETATLDGHGADVLALRTLHLRNVASLRESGTALVAGVDYEWSTNGELRRLSGRWTSRWRALEVTFEHGFDAAADLAQIVQQVVANAVASPMGATREQAGVVSISWSTTAPGVSGGISLLERDLLVLDTYRLSRGA